MRCLTPILPCLSWVQLWIFFFFPPPKVNSITWWWRAGADIRLLCLAFSYLISPAAPISTVRHVSFLKSSWGKSAKVITNYTNLIKSHSEQGTRCTGVDMKPSSHQSVFAGGNQLHPFRILSCKSLHLPFKSKEFQGGCSFLLKSLHREKKCCCLQNEESLGLVPFLL